MAEQEDKKTKLEADFERVAKQLEKAARPFAGISAQLGAAEKLAGSSLRQANEILRQFGGVDRLSKMAAEVAGLGSKLDLSSISRSVGSFDFPLSTQAASLYGPLGFKAPAIAGVLSGGEGLARALEALNTSPLQKTLLDFGHLGDGLIERMGGASRLAEFAAMRSPFEELAARPGLMQQLASLGSPVDHLAEWPTVKASFLAQIPALEQWASETRGEIPGPFQDLVDRALEPVVDEAAATTRLDDLVAQADAVIQTADTSENRQRAQAITSVVVLMFIGRALLQDAAVKAAWKSPDAIEWLLLALLSVFSPVGTLPVPSPPTALVLRAAPGAPNIQSWQAAGLPEIIKRAGPQAQKRTIEFFAAEIRNTNTRQAYMRAVSKFFMWCEDRDLALEDISPFVVAAYIEELQHDASAPTVKQHLAAIRMLFDYLVVGQVLPMNPASSVRGPKHVVKRGKTPVLTADQARQLIDSIDTSEVIGLRDRALIGVMVFSFARVSATVGMRVEDYYPTGKRWWFRLHEKGGKRHEVPAHHNAEAYLDAYIEAAGIGDEKKGPLFRTVGRNRQITRTPMHRTDVLRMIYRRAKGAGLDVHACCHTFRATGITAYLENGGTIEKAQQIAAHESPRTTKLYDRTNDEITLDEIERIII